MMQRTEILLPEATEENLTPYNREMSIAQPLDLYLANMNDDHDDDVDVDDCEEDEDEGNRLLVVRTGSKRRFDRDDGEEQQQVDLPPLPPPKRLCRRSPKVYAASRCVSPFSSEDDEGTTTNMTAKVLSYGDGAYDGASFFFRDGATADESLLERFAAAAIRRRDDVDHRSFWGDVPALEDNDDDERSHETTASEWERSPWTVW
mmetsp:Transcript_20988/g.49732  ORF Transcript_20988/g.49732 Transcript_20988/m.49732 type:complete len:204 (-) Transcript_20988:195-806(-)